MLGLRSGSPTRNDIDGKDIDDVTKRLRVMGKVSILKRITATATATVLGGISKALTTTFSK